MFFIADSAAVFLLRSRGESRGSEVVLGFLDTVFPFLKYIWKGTKINSRKIKLENDEGGDYFLVILFFFILIL